MKKILALLVIPLVSVSLAFTQDAQNVEQQTQNKGAGTQLKNRVQTKHQQHKQSMHQYQKQIQSQNKANRKQAKGAK